MYVDNSNFTKTCLITGANSGIGKSAAIQIARKGFTVIIGCRNVEKGQKALYEIIDRSGSGTIELIQIDMSSKVSIYEAAKTLKERFKVIDVLINNAADFDLSREKAELSSDGIETIWATNHIGPVLLTNLLIEPINRSIQGRIITVASKGLILYPHLTVDLNDPEFKSRKFSVPKAYYQSKLAQVMYTFWLAEKLKDTKITVNCIRVPNVKIDICRYPNLTAFMKFMYSIKSKFSISPDEMAKTYVYLATSPELSAITGKYFDEQNKVVKAAPYCSDWVRIEEVMKLTMKYIE